MFNSMNRIKIHLWALDMPQYELAEKAGLTESQVSAAIRRNKATARTREKISEALAVPENELFPYGSK